MSLTRRQHSIAAQCALLLLLSSAPGCARTDVVSRVRKALSLEHKPRPPKYTNSFEVSYNFTLPYERSYLPDGLVLPVRVWRDEETKMVRMDTYHGINSLISTEKANLEISPHVDELACAKFKNDPGEPRLFDVPILPDVSDWEYRGTEELRGQRALVWEYVRRHGDKRTAYKFYAARNGDPLRLHMHGNDAFSGAHFDVYIADYSGYKPGPQAKHIFEPPELCRDVRFSQREGPSGFQLRMQALAPVVRYGGATNSLYEQFLAANTRLFGSLREYKSREDVFARNAELIDAFNSHPNRTSTAGLNRFADWSQAEFEAVMLPRHAQRRGLVSRRQPSAAVPYERRAPVGTIPGGVDWRGTPADAVVKDQAACGSCWAFGMSGALEAAHYLATGKQRLFSEQQVMDCSWGYGLNKACDGGDYDAAMDYLKHAGGLVDEQRYEYLGADGFCRTKNFTADELVPFEGYAYVPSGDDEALMEAVYSRGPVAVSLDASQPSFRFYSGGVLDEPNCMWKSEDLDHAVLLVGYGTCPETGKPYWLIRNSWSTYWGDKGYVKIARAHHGCGISTDPVYAVFNSTRSADEQRSLNPVSPGRQH